MDKIIYSDLKIIKKIGSGRYGKVYLAENKNKKYPNKLAIKAVKKDNELIANHEINIYKRIESIFIVKFFTSFEDSSKIYYVFEYLSKGDLYYKIRKGPLKYENAFSYFKQVTFGLNYLHSIGIMHRDIKPENILIDDANNVKITDLGLAIEFKEGEKFKEFAGTLYYLAPEIILNKPYDYRIDLWMLGILFYEMLAGKPPFYDNYEENVYRQIIKGEVVYPIYFSLKTSITINKLIRVNPVERMSLWEIILLE